MAKNNDNIEKESYVTTREAALLLDVSLRTIQLWVESGILNAWKTAGGHRRIPKSSISKLLDQHQADMDSHRQEHKLKILVVEDDPMIMEVYLVHIHSWGLNCQVLTAKDGYDGLLQIGRHQPDIIFSDLMMPDMDGFRMIRSLKARDETKGTQIIVVTMLDEQQIADKGGLPQDVLILNKPIQFDVLKGIVLGKMTALKAL